MGTLHRALWENLWGLAVLPVRQAVQMSQPDHSYTRQGRSSPTRPYKPTNRATQFRVNNKRCAKGLWVGTIPLHLGSSAQWPERGGGGA